MEQRIQNLEGEFKLLKNQIRAVLLDIKESLTSGEWQSLPPVWEPEQDAADQFAEPTGQQPQQDANYLDSTPGVTQVSTPASIDIPDGGGGPTIPADEVPHFAKPAPPAMTSTKPANNNSDKKNMPNPDLLTMIMLTRWLEKATATVGKKQAQKLVAMYNATADLPQELKQALILLTDVYGNNGSQHQKSSAATIPLLLELDNLLRQPDYSLKSAVISMLTDNDCLNNENYPRPSGPRKHSKHNYRKEKRLTNNPNTVEAEHGY
jgi:hypothetical protein